MATPPHSILRMRENKKSVDGEEREE